MSFQTLPTQPTPPAKGARRSGLLGLGIILLLLGIVAGIILFISSGSQYEKAVKDLQRAPVGCDTEFNFTGTGTFIFYAESKGKIGNLRGDCDNTDTDYTHDGAIDVDLTLVNDLGDEVKLDRADGASYDKSGYVGKEIRSIKLDEPGKYTLSVSSDDTDFTIAVGRNPKDDADTVMGFGIIALIAGVVIGGLFIILGLRRKPAATTPNSWNPTGGNLGNYQPVDAPPLTSYPPTGPPPSQPAWQPAPPQTGPTQPYPPQAYPPQQPPPPPSGSPWGSPQP